MCVLFFETTTRLEEEEEEEEEDKEEEDAERALLRLRRLRGSLVFTPDRLGPLVRANLRRRGRQKRAALQV